MVVLVKMEHRVNEVVIQFPAVEMVYPLAHILHCVELTTFVQLVRELWVHPFEVFKRYPEKQLEQTVAELTIAQLVSEVTVHTLEEFGTLPVAQVLANVHPLLPFDL